MNRLIGVLLLISNYWGVQAQKNVRTFIFGHSLINHEYQVNVTPSQETSVPHWFHFLANEANHNYAVSGQYGFLQQHVNLPPIAQWGFDSVQGAWDSDLESFAAANFTNILLTPSNFEQWQPPTADYYNDTLSPIEATNHIFNWCSQQEDSMTYYLYENWPDMGPYLNNGFPPTQQEWQNYNTYLNGGFHDWFLEYHDSVMNANPNLCIRMIPVGPIISGLLNQAPFNQIPLTTLYEDDAPHGRPTLYFLAAMITYMAMYEEPTPNSYNFMPAQYIDPIVANNYQAATNYIWNELQNFNDSFGNNRVFCQTQSYTNYGTDIQMACDSYTWIDGNVYTSSNNTATHTLINQLGGDSIVTLNLTINHFTTGVDTQIACDSFTWIDGNTYTSSNNNATYILVNQQGCDSVLTLDLTVSETYQNTIDTTICYGSSYATDGNNYTSTGSYTNTYTSVSGCDSVITINLTVQNEINSTITAQGSTLTVGEVGATYQWLDCTNGNVLIQGATNQSYTANNSGEYAVTVSNMHCSSTSDCFELEQISSMLDTPKRVNEIYPNPFNEVLFISVNSPVELSIVDVTGKLIYQKNSQGGLIKIATDSLVEGVYFVKLISDDEEQFVKLIKK